MRDLWVLTAVAMMVPLGAGHARAQPGDWPVLRGPYLGQKPPGATPEVFAPGIISTEAAEGCSHFSNDDRLFLFAQTRSSQDGVFIMEQENGVWGEPHLAPFSAGGHDWDFTLTPDGTTVLVSSGRPTSEGGSPEEDYRIWVSERIDDGWSPPRLLPAPVNTGQHDSYPSVTADGTLYFFSRRDGGLGLGDIYRSKRVDEQYTEVENLGGPINTEHHDLDPFIAPDESYLVFSSDRPGGYGSDDLYVAFRKKGGTWTEPVNMGPSINSPREEYIPSMSLDGEQFFFTTNKSGQRDIYWVDASVIEELRPVGPGGAIEATRIGH